MTRAWKWFGRPGHYICSARCIFHMHTHVGRYCVSTVGEFHEHHRDPGPVEIGDGRLYETMVFALDANDSHNGSEIDFRPYNDWEAADTGHLEMCEKWAK